MYTSGGSTISPIGTFDVLQRWCQTSPGVCPRLRQQTNKPALPVFPPPPQAVELGEWVPWELQSEDHEAPSNSENCKEVVPDPPRGVEAPTTATPSGGEEGEGGAMKENDGTPPNPSTSPASDEKRPHGPSGKGTPEWTIDRAPTTFVSVSCGAAASRGFGAMRGIHCSTYAFASKDMCSAHNAACYF